MLLTFIVFTLSNCEIKVKQATAQSTESSWSDYYFNGMHYKMKYCYMHGNGGNAHENGIASIAVINVTKDSLECEFYKQKLK